jgi:hypothetical protein
MDVDMFFWFWPGLRKFTEAGDSASSCVRKVKAFEFAGWRTSSVSTALQPVSFNSRIAELTW